jgi:penicillin amidase
MVLYPGYYLPENRAKRITQLEPKSNWDKESVGKMITDNTSSVAPDMVKNLISVLDSNSLKNEKEAVVILKSWKGTNNTEDVALHLQ